MEKKFPQLMDSMLMKVLLKQNYRMERTWLKCQGYEYEPNPAGFAAASRDARQVAVRESEQITLYGKLAVDFFSCEEHLVSGVTLRFSF